MGIANKALDIVPDLEKSIDSVCDKSKAIIIKAMECNAESRKKVDDLYSIRASAYQKEMNKAQTFEEKKYWNEKFKQANRECEKCHEKDTNTNKDLAIKSI